MILHQKDQNRNQCKLVDLEALFGFLGKPLDIFRPGDAALQSLKPPPKPSGYADTIRFVTWSTGPKGWYLTEVVAALQSLPSLTVLFFTLRLEARTGTPFSQFASSLALRVQKK